jgi:methyl-accepting chemotaxis protein
MRNLKIKAKVWSLVIIFGAGYAFILILQQWAASETASHMTIASGTLFPAALSIQEAEASFQKVKKRYNDAVLLQDKKALAGAEQDGQGVLSALQSVQGKTGLAPELRESIAREIEKFSDIQARSKPVYAAMIENPDSISDKTQAAVADLAKENKDLESSLAVTRESVSKAFAGELEAVTLWSQRQRNFGLVVVVVASLIGSMVAFVVIERQIVRPLQQVALRLKDIAEGEGDLTRRIQTTSHDEIGEVANWFNIFMDKLQNVISNVGVNTEGVASSSQQLSTLSETLSANAEETSNQANQVSTAAEEVTRNLRTVAAGTGEMSSSIHDIARNASDAARISREAVELAVSTNSTISKLGEAGAQIGGVVKVITSIAEQTDLLALNATIEASRAGSAGAGFAVVADEVRELAAKTAKATKDIAERIDAIQKGTKAAVEAIGKIGKTIDQISSIAATIAAAVEEQSATTAEISRNIDEAARGSGSISEHISGVASAADGTSHKVAESRKAVEQLADVSSQLHELVEQFKC